MLGKVAAGAIKGGAKKIATNKLLNREKKVMMGTKTEEEKGGSLAIRPTTSLVSSPTSAIEKYSGAGQESGGDGSLEGTVIRIKTTVIQVEKLLGNSIAFQKKQLDKKRKVNERAEVDKAEKDLEKKKPKQAKGKMKLKLPGKGIFSSIISFISNILFGYVMVRLVDFLPKLQAILPVLGEIADFVVNFAGGILNGLSTLINWGYKFVEMARGLVTNVFGEDGAAKFDIFMTNIKDLIQGFLLWKILGQKVFKAIVSNLKNAFKFGRNLIRRAMAMAGRFIGRGGRQLVKGVISKGANIVGKGVSAITNVGGKVAGKVGGFATKIFGKAANVIAPALKTALPAVKGFARRIPILGPIIVGLVSAMTGDPVGQALFKAGGAALGGALGTFIPIPVLGTLIGETVGVYVGDVLYELLMGGGMAAAGQKLKDDFGKLLSGGEKVFGWIKDGFGRLMEGLPKGPIGLGKWFLFGNIVDKVKLLGKAFFSRDPMTGEKEEEDIEDTKKGAVDGKEPPKPKTDRGEKLQSSSSMTYSSTTGVSTYKVEGEEVSKEEFDKYRSLSKEEKRKYVTPMRGDANNILATNNNIRDGVAQRASYEEGAEETVLIQEPDTSSDSKKEEVGETKTLIVNTGATEDTFESLYVR